MKKSGPAIVLVRPRNPLNIGAVARAAANFGIDDLRVVAPHPPVWQEVLRSAVGASSVIRGARVFGDLAAATADRTLILGTTCLKARKLSLPVHDLARCPSSIRPGLVFGPEKTGLTSADLACCDAVLRIPTDPECPSMNLGQAVAVICYELTRGLPQSGGPPQDRVSSAEVERLVEAAEAALVKIGYRRGMTSGARRAKIRSLFRHRGVSKAEAGMTHEILRRIASLPER